MTLFEQGNHHRTKRCTWLQASGYREGDGHVFLYTVSLYWALTAISTVGFGDYTPMNLNEMIYACFVVVAGVAWYSLIISSVTSVFDAHDKTSGLQWRTRVLNRFVHKYKIPAHLAAALHGHNRQQFDHGHHWRNADNEASILIGSLSRPLRRILALHIEAKLIKKIPFFRGKPNAFVADAVVLLRPQISVTGETILIAGSVANALHLIVAGTVSIRIVDDNLETEELGRMKNGAYFGDEGCLLQAYFLGNLDAVEPLSLELIDKDALRKLLDGFPHVHESLVDTAKCRLKYSGILALCASSRRSRHSILLDIDQPAHHGPQHLSAADPNCCRGCSCLGLGGVRRRRCRRLLLAAASRPSAALHHPQDRPNSSAFARPRHKSSRQDPHRERRGPPRDRRGLHRG